MAEGHVVPFLTLGFFEMDVAGSVDFQNTREKKGSVALFTWLVDTITEVAVVKHLPDELDAFRIV